MQDVQCMYLFMSLSYCILLLQPTAGCTMYVSVYVIVLLYPFTAADCRMYNVCICLCHCLIVSFYCSQLQDVQCMYLFMSLSYCILLLQPTAGCTIYVSVYVIVLLYPF